MVRVDNRGLDALIIISITIIVIIAAVITIIITTAIIVVIAAVFDMVAVVGIVVGVRIAVGVVNLNDWLKLGCTPLIDVGYCYDVIVVILVFDFVILGVDDCGAILSCNNVEWGKVVWVLFCSVFRMALGVNLVLNDRGVMV